MIVYIYIERIWGIMNVIRLFVSTVFILTIHLCGEISSSENKPELLNGIINFKHPEFDQQTVEIIKDRLNNLDQTVTDYSLMTEWSTNNQNVDRNVEKFIEFTRESFNKINNLTEYMNTIPQSKVSHKGIKELLKSTERIKEDITKEQTKVIICYDKIKRNHNK